MKAIVVLLFIMYAIIIPVQAQVYIEPSVGYQIDVNKNNSFKQAASAVQAALKLSRHYELLFQVQKTWALKYNGTDSAFTTNLTLPLYAPAQKTVRPSSFSVAIGHRISVAGTTNNKLSLLVYTGFVFQKFAVTYQYDKNNYTLLNPDKTLTAAGLYASGGIEYMRVLKTGRFFIQLLVATPPAQERFDYPASFNFMAPVSFNAGYSILIKKR